MKIKARDLILLAKVIEREMQSIGSDEREVLAESTVDVVLKEENLAEGRLVATLCAELGYAVNIMNKRGKTPAVENRLIRTEIYDFSEHKRPCIVRYEQEMQKGEDPTNNSDPIPF